LINKKHAQITKYLLLFLSAFALVSTFCLCNYSPLTIKTQLKVRPLNDRKGSAYNSVVGPAYLFIQEQAKSGDMVAYSRSAMFIYPLWNRDYTNKVIYLPETDAQAWILKIRDNEVDYIFTHRVNDESKWSKENNFEKLYEDESYEIYRTN
jgi:hypothetical protein